MSSFFKRYLKETRQPPYAAALVFPFFFIYHAGIVLLDIGYINGADALIVRLLNAVSVHSLFGSALILVAFFAAWQLHTKASWKIKLKVLSLSFAESLALALVLLFIFGRLIPHFNMSLSPSGGNISNLVLYCGAGIYEELVFRVFLLGILIQFFRRIMHFKDNASAFFAAVLAALLFSAFHYLGPAGDAFTIGSFLQRMVGGLYFSLVFVMRGYGITAACHVFYDIAIGSFSG